MPTLIIVRVGLGISTDGVETEDDTVPSYGTSSGYTDDPRAQAQSLIATMQFAHPRGTNLDSKDEEEELFELRPRSRTKTWDEEEEIGVAR